MKIKYRADIDGLRAIAVLCVMFFHLGIPGFSGGFIGVDIFFVISGYLITSIIIKDIQSGQFSIAGFYERRIRRIFPALFSVIAFIIVVGAFLFDPEYYKDFGSTVTATTLFSSNILFWHRSGYFDINSLSRPLLQTWSLAVEEQFYIFFPLLLILIYRFSKSRYFQWILGICILSLIISIYGVFNYQVASFYLLPSRGWELLFGALLSTGFIPDIKSNLYRNVASFLGLGLIVFSVCLYNKDTIFPGYTALPPVLGSTLIIYSGMGGSFIKNLLSFKPLVYIGLISYPLYLWHWPLIVISKYLSFTELTSLEITGIIIISFLFSILSYKFIEKPFRGINPFITNRRKLFIYSVFLIVIFSFIGSLIHIKNGFYGRFSIQASVIEEMENNQNQSFWQKSENIDQIQKLMEGKLPPRVGLISSKPVFLLWGDSHARALIPAISYQANKNGLSGWITTQNGYPPLIGMDFITTSTLTLNYKMNDKIISFISSHPEIRTVILAAAWGKYSNGHGYKDTEQNIRIIDNVNHDSNDHNPILLRRGLIRTANYIIKLGRKVVIVCDVPDLGYPVRRLYLRNGKGLPTLSDYQKFNVNVSDFFNTLSNNKSIVILHPEVMFFNKDNKVKILNNNKLLYVDIHHLSKYGAEFVSPVFDEIFMQMAKVK